MTSLSQVAPAVSRQLACQQEELLSIPSLPALLAEEAGLIELLALQSAALVRAHAALQSIRAQSSHHQETAAQQEAAAAAGDSPWGGLTSWEEGAAIADSHHSAAQATEALVGLLDQVSAAQLALDATQRRLETLPQLREIAIRNLADVEDVAVQTRDAADWTYEYAASMAEVGSDDPDSALTERMQAREHDKKFDCDTFVVHCLEEAGYDLDAEITVAGQTTTVRRFVMIHAETIFREEFKIGQTTHDGDGNEIREDLSGPERLVALKDCLDRDDPRMKGVVAALTLSGQGTEITNMSDLRPGDLVQYWKRSTKVPEGKDGVSGHAVVIHKVVTSRGVLHEKSAPFPEPVKVTGVQVLSAHAQVDGNDVYTKKPVDLDGGSFYRWFGVRPAGSLWPMQDVQ